MRRAGMPGKPAPGPGPAPIRRPIKPPAPRILSPGIRRGVAKPPGISQRPMPHRRAVPVPGRVVPPAVMVKPDIVKPLPLLHEKKKRARRMPPLSPRLRKRL